MQFPSSVPQDSSSSSCLMQLEVVTRQQVEADLAIERERLQSLRSLLDEISVPSSPDDQAVDKTLVTNLFVSYFLTNK